LQAEEKQKPEIQNGKHEVGRGSLAGKLFLTSVTHNIFYKSLGS